MKLISDVRIGRWELCVHGVFAACAVLHLLFWCAGIRFDGLSFGSQIAMMRVAGCPPHGVPSWCARPSLLQTFAHLRELERGICSVLHGTRQNRLGMLYAPSRAAAVLANEIPTVCANCIPAKAEPLFFERCAWPGS